MTKFGHTRGLFVWKRTVTFGLIGVGLIGLDSIVALPLGNPSDQRALSTQKELLFEANEGQTRSDVKFLTRTSAYTLLLSQSSARLAFKNAKSFLAIDFAGANHKAGISGVRPSSATVNYFSGADSRSWIRNVSTYEKVRYAALYQNIDAIFYGQDGLLEYDFVVKPGADPKQIAMRFSSHARPRVLANGDLVISVGDGELRSHSPELYQTSDPDGSRADSSSNVRGSYRLNRDHTVGFTVAAYDPTKTLVIDPVVAYSSYLGGTDDEGIFGIQHDAEGNLYVAGETSSLNFPTLKPSQKDVGGDYDAFVSKFDPSGTHLIYSTYLGGSGYDHAVGLAVSPNGDAFVAGETTSVNFPTRKALQALLKGGTNGFVARLSHSGSDLVFGTYLGGSQFDYPQNITLDQHSNIYLAGGTNSPDFPVTPGVFQTQCDGPNGLNPGSCNFDGFVAKLAPDGSKLIYSTFLGGRSSDSAYGITVDQTGAAFVTGQSGSADFPVLKAYQHNLAGNANAFVSKLSPTGTRLEYSTYLGGSDFDGGTDIAIGPEGEVYVTGTTSSTNFPLAKPFQGSIASGNAHCFVAKLSRNGDELLRSSYFGGNGWDYPSKLGVDVFGSMSIIGFTQSTDLLTVHAVQKTFGGGISDAFVLKLLPESFAPLYSTYLGGRGDEYGYGIHSEEFGSVWIGGSTSSKDFLIRRGFQSTYAGGPYDAFLTRLTLTIPDYFRILEDLLAGDTVFLQTSTLRQKAAAQRYSAGNNAEDTIADLEDLDSILVREATAGELTPLQLQRALAVSQTIQRALRSPIQ